VKAGSTRASTASARAMPRVARPCRLPAPPVPDRSLASPTSSSTGFLRQDPALLADFVGQTVGTVQAYDARRRTDLLLTLEVWAAEGGSPTAAAERLHVHPHTVTYRLGRIEELTGLSLSAPDDRLQLLLGLRAARLLGSSFVSSTKLHAGDSGRPPDDSRARSR